MIYIKKLFKIRHIILILELLKISSYLPYRNFLDILSSLSTVKLYKEIKAN